MVKDLVFIVVGSVAVAWIVRFFAPSEAYWRGYRTAVREAWAQKFARRGEASNAARPEQSQDR